jgi:hypothetical protein
MAAGVGELGDPGVERAAPFVLVAHEGGRSVCSACAGALWLLAQFPAPLTTVGYSTVTDFARFLGLSMSRPRTLAVW